MRNLFLIVLIFFSAFYLNFSYARIYNFIKEHKLPNPTLQQRYTLKNDQNIFSGASDKDQQKYMALGDSLTSGVGSQSYEKTFPYILAQKLASGKKDMLLINLGQPGADIAEVLKFQVPEAIRENPDYLSLLIGTNDVHNFTSRDSFRNSYKVIISNLSQQTKAKIILINIPYLGTKDLIWPPHNLWLNFRIRQFNEDIAQIAQEGNLHLEDLYTQTKKLSSQPGFYSADLFHPSAEGYILWGQIINAD
ncbi:MAG: hypothetical protein UU73_C0003G0308 [Candidatus Daviesbacteria bacterium GW2011_GWA1_41_61]|uniref:SGNH hydrolase-type esterase domain-containing protein n=1 Tax=Candidatus Daviesbacteria bacterium GW2011_GWA2_40_9 TaxID=1618424 RepID=A0A0G0X504_9BACT|nr:MAG: hypothetical protein UU26_C0035G0003 [Candidatus Daviesbacteria bacterium GW2011_GWC1_40_9]KKR82702.1 MAG: hypothetical protein UU29_C0010G0048 [Candidatus Daviesbacteria bacterium GW2011_GWA2_40_9]KKR93342.1 MAG: hypothetical protein UU44_C0002G0003 [Candidatus Daviesbacteria bacterium GW2011_GWB1_41_15]KKS15109.1 MAG: hypothetical protein UU73_C0003G0308 [Candidatus Daviesbacteria bacterium GW2011_GWA1_41_61]